jgi:hypothetical protein
MAAGNGLIFPCPDDKIVQRFHRIRLADFQRLRSRRHYGDGLKIELDARIQNGMRGHGVAEGRQEIGAFRRGFANIAYANVTAGPCPILYND